MPRGFGGIERVVRRGVLSGYRAVVYVAGRREYGQVCAKEAEARVWLRELRQQKVEIESGAASRRPSTRRTVEQFAARLLEWYAAGTRRKYSTTTLAGYRLEVAAVVERFGARRLTDLSRADVVDWIRDMERGGMSTSAQRHRLDRLSAMFRVAVEDGLLPRVPFAVPRPALRQRSEPEALDERSYERLTRAARAVRDRRVVLLAGDAGLRRGEIFAARRVDVTLGRRTDGTWGVILVPQRDERAGPKHGSVRAVPILTQRLHDALKSRDEDGDEGALVAGLETVRSLERIAHEIYVAAKLEQPSQPLHALRHRFGTCWAGEGAPLKWLRDVMGHRTVLTTERYFRRRGGELPAAVAEKLTGSATRPGRAGATKAATRCRS